MFRATIKGLALAGALGLCAAPPASATSLQGPSKVLFRASWSSGIHNWARSGGTWKVQGGMLTYGGVDVSMLLAPYTPRHGSYAVEAAIRLVNWKTSGLSESQGFGVLI